MGLIEYLKRGARFVLFGVPEYKTTVEIHVMESQNLLQVRNIIVTGGGRGIGYYVAKKSIDEGANVLITGRNEKTLKEAVGKLGEHAQYVVSDVSKVKEIDSFLDKAKECFHGNKIDSLVSNAGISLHEGNFHNVTEEDWDIQMDTNLKGNYFLVKKFVEYLEQQEDKNGNIVVITSERAKRPDDIPYGLTKVATSSFVQAIAHKVIAEGIRINGVGPGVTTSDMTGILRENIHAEWQVGKRCFVQEEIAEVVNFLLSDTSACISGEIITCNQGNHIARW